MKNLIKIVSVAAVAALTLSCISAFAKSGKSGAGQETASTQVTVEEKKAERGKDKADKPELTEEEKAAMAEKMKAKLAEKLAEGKITQEEYDAELAKIESGDFKPDRKGGKDKAAKPELTEEEKAARAEKMKAKLAEKLAEGKITQEEYDAELAKIESGDLKHGHGKGHSKHRPHDKAESETTAE